MANNTSIKFNFELPQEAIKEWFEGKAKVEAAKQSHKSCPLGFSTNSISCFIKDLLWAYGISCMRDKETKCCPKEETVADLFKRHFEGNAPKEETMKCIDLQHVISQIIHTVKEQVKEPETFSFDTEQSLMSLFQAYVDRHEDKEVAVSALASIIMDAITEMRTKKEKEQLNKVETKEKKDVKQEDSCSTPKTVNKTRSEKLPTHETLNTFISLAAEIVSKMDKNKSNQQEESLDKVETKAEDKSDTTDFKLDVKMDESTPLECTPKTETSKKQSTTKRPRKKVTYDDSEPHNFTQGLNFESGANNMLSAFTPFLNDPRITTMLGSMVNMDNILNKGNFKENKDSTTTENGTQYYQE